MAVLPNILLNGTTADANEVMDDFYEIYSDIDSTNIAVSGRTGTDGSKIVLQDNPVFLTAVNLHSGADLKSYSDAGSTLKFTVDGATGNFATVATGKLFLDGTDLLGDTFLQESSANTVQLTTGGSVRMQWGTSVSVNAVDLVLSPINKLRLDGNAAGNTYISESASDVIQIVAGNVLSLQLSSSSIATGPIDFVVNATNKVRWDGSAAGDTYTYESSPNVLDTLVGATLAQRINSAGENLMPAVDPPTANYANRNGIVKAWCDFVVTGASAASANASYNVSTGSISVSSYAITIPWNTDMSTANYAVVAMMSGGSGQIGTIICSKAAGSVTLYAITPAGAAYSSGWFGTVMAIGTQ